MHIYSITVRLTLAVSVIAAWCRLRNTLQKQFGNTYAWWYTLITVTQYHFMFYMSRPLPNIMVLPLGKLLLNFTNIFLHNIFYFWWWLYLDRMCNTINF